MLLCRQEQENLETPELEELKGRSAWHLHFDLRKNERLYFPSPLAAGGLGEAGRERSKMKRGPYIKHQQ